MISPSSPSACLLLCALTSARFIAGTRMLCPSGSIVNVMPRTRLVRSGSRKIVPTMGLSHDRHMFFCNYSRPFFRVRANSGLKLDFLHRISIRATRLGMQEAFSSIYKDGCGDFGTLSDTRHSAPVRVCRSGPGGFVAHLDVETASRLLHFVLRAHCFLRPQTTPSATMVSMFALPLPANCFQNSSPVSPPSISVFIF